MTNPYIPTPLTQHTLARAEAINAQFQAISDAFGELPDFASFAGSLFLFAPDTGAKNAYVLTPGVAITEYDEGMTFYFKPNATNDAASTANVSGLGVKNIVHGNGSALVAGDLVATGIATIVYDGMQFVLAGFNGSTETNAAASATAAAASATGAGISQTNAAASATAAAASNTNAATSATNSANSATASGASATAAAASAASAAALVGATGWVAAGGTVNAITATYAPAVTNLTDGMSLAFRSTGANSTTTPTFQANATTARTITKAGGAPLAAGDIGPSLTEHFLRYNLANTRWELLNPVTEPSLVKGTFVPIDASGAGLALTAVSGFYRKSSAMVEVWGSVTYPATADGMGASIGGFPFNCAPTGVSILGSMSVGGGGGYIGGGPNAIYISSGTNHAFITIGGGATALNSDASTFTVNFNISYPI